MFKDKEKIQEIKEKRANRPLEWGYQLVSLLEMLFQYASNYIWLLDVVKLMESREFLSEVSDISGDKADKIRKYANKEIVSEALKRLKFLDMPMSELQCRRLNSILNSKEPLDVSEIQRQYGELHQRIKDELLSKQFYHVRTDRIVFYNENQFSDEIVNRFNLAIYDMEEAGKCFALGRYTACAFHLLRVVEAGLDELCKHLNIPEYIPTWDGVLKQIEKYINKLDGKRDKSEIEKLSSIVLNITAIKNVWRNPTMHVEKKYNGEEAEEIFVAAKNFMKNLSKGFSGT